MSVINSLEVIDVQDHSTAIGFQPIPPSADFITTGKVTNIQTNIGIGNIKVEMGYDSVKTDTNGNFTIKKTDFPNIPDTFQIKCSDIDGVLHSSYQEKDTFVIFSDKNFTGGDGHWYNGKTVKNIIIPLKPKS